MLDVSCAERGRVPFMRFVGVCVCKIACKIGEMEGWHNVFARLVVRANNPQFGPRPWMKGTTFLKEEKMYSTHVMDIL